MNNWKWWKGPNSSTYDTLSYPPAEEMWIINFNDVDWCRESWDGVHLRSDQRRSGARRDASVQSGQPHRVHVRHAAPGSTHTRRMEMGRMQVNKKFNSLIIHVYCPFLLNIMFFEDLIAKKKLWIYWGSNPVPESSKKVVLNSNPIHPYHHLSVDNANFAI